MRKVVSEGYMCESCHSINDSFTTIKNCPTCNEETCKHCGHYNQSVTQIHCENCLEDN